MHVGEQIGRYSSLAMKRWAKRTARKKWRQAVRRDVENAPAKRRYAGWND